MAQPGHATFVRAFATTRASPSNCTGLADSERPMQNEREAHAETRDVHTEKRQKVERHCPMAMKGHRYRRLN